MLGLGRALGETMAVTFVIGNASLIGSCSCPATASPRRWPTNSPRRRPACIPRRWSSYLILFVITFIVPSLWAAVRSLEKQSGGSAH